MATTAILILSLPLWHSYDILGCVMCVCVCVWFCLFVCQCRLCLIRCRTNQTIKHCFYLSASQYDSFIFVDPNIRTLSPFKIPLVLRYYSEAFLSVPDVKKTAKIMRYYKKLAERQAQCLSSATRLPGLWVESPNFSLTYKKHTLCTGMYVYSSKYQMSTW